MATIHTIHTQDFAVRSLQTKSVTLYPNKAQIVRVIKGISLRPGPNQVIVEGFTPTVDENSIKVEGTGTATITDLSVQLIANREAYEDVYPEDEDDEDEENESEDDEEQKKDEGVEAVQQKINEVNEEITAERELINSAASRLEFLQKFGNSIKDERPTDLTEFLSKYQAERVKVFEDHNAASTRVKTLEKKAWELRQEKDRLEKALEKARQKEMKEKAKAKEKKQRKLREKAQEKARVFAERSKFWPKKVYKVIISLDGSSGLTPASSRRGSMDSLVSLPKEQDIKSIDGEVNLSISYITYSASWSPHYDLSLNTVTSSGVLDFSAELRNTTSETWSDAKVTLSTSQTSYQGLGETIPQLHAWHVRLSKGVTGQNGALYSTYEKQMPKHRAADIPAQLHAPRHELFGLPGSNVGPVHQQPLQVRVQSGSLFGPNPFKPCATTAHGSLFGPQADNVNQRPAPPAPSAPIQMQQQSMFGATHGPPQTWDSVAVPAPPPAPMASAHRPLPTFAKRMSAAPRGEMRIASTRAGGAYDYDEDPEGALMDDATFTEPDPTLLFEESSFEETGLTTTYDVPSLKTLTPMSSTTKHKIVRIDFKSITFSHILIPKLKTAAFLKARLQNSSKITLLKGTAGLTLDGSFLGQSAIPRCSAGDSFSLPLGVDPTISVNYSKPTVRRSQSGIFSKEDCEVFNRTITVANSKNAPVELLVLDQVPVSEEERLRIETVSPRGLRVGGEAVPAGVGIATSSSSSSSNEGGSGGGKWGSATAFMKKGGEVNWKIKLNPQRGCKLVLEYEATYPGGEAVIAA